MSCFLRLFIDTKLYSVMDKLPPTSYIRMVDIWLIFVQLYPFIQEKALLSLRNKRILNRLQILYLQVVLSTIIELNVEEEFTNDHGFRRSVPQNKNNVCTVCFHNKHLEIYHLEHRNKALW